MKIRKILTAAFLAAFVILTAVCLAFGPQIRDMLSPRAEYVCPEYMTADGQVFLTLPEAAIRTDGEGNEYVLVAKQSQKYPERCFEAVRADVRVMNVTGGAAVIASGVRTGDRVIVSGEVNEGERVVAEARG